MSQPILILNGPNLNRLGKREPHIYGTTSLADVEQMCKERVAKRGYTIAFHQSNREYEIIDWIHEGIDNASGIIINAGAFTHTSVPILDALRMFDKPIIELHISNPHRREAFRQVSYISYVATGSICGLGISGYLIAVDAMVNILNAK